MSQYSSNCPRFRISMDCDGCETAGASLGGIYITVSPNPNYKVTVLFEQVDSDAGLQ